MFKSLKKDWPILLILFASLVAAVLVYPRMPERVPTHWNLNGEVDDYSSRLFGTFFLPVLNIAMYVLFLVLPKLDPKRANYEKFGSSYQIIKYALIVFMSVVFAVTIAVSLGYQVNVGKVIPIGVSILFIIMGNIMGRVRHNYFVGFKFPWTLANEEVWKKTHQLGAKLMVLGGVIALLGSIFSEGAVSFIIMMAGIFIPVLITTVYSYIIYQRIVK